MHLGNGKGSGGQRRPDRGQVGIEGLIVFIALIIVAMFAVVVLLGATGSLQNSASVTSEESTASVVQQVSVFSVHERDNEIIEEYQLESRNVTLDNRTATFSNGSSSLSLDWDEPMGVTVNGTGNVTLEAEGETIYVEDGQVLQATSFSTADQVALKNVNTSETLPTAGQITVQNDSDGSTEAVTLSYDGSSVAAVEETDLSVTTTLSSTELLTTETATASVSSGGSVEIAGGGETLIVNDGDRLRFFYRNDTIKNVDAGTEASIEEFEVSDDGDGTPDETLTLQYYGESVSLTESSPFRIEQSPRQGVLTEDSGTTRTVSVSSGGNVTLSDGSSTLDLRDGDDLRVTTLVDDAFKLENVDTGDTLETDSSALDIVDDGDGTSDESLSIGPIYLEEDANAKLRLDSDQRRTSHDDYGIYTIKVGKSPGADSIDLSTATIEVIGPSNSTTLTYVDAASPRTRDTFVVNPVVDEDGTDPVLTDDSDRFLLRFDAGSVPEGEELVIRITTASGATKEIIIEADGEGFRG